MQGNRSRDTKPELRLRQLLWGAGHRGYRLHRKRLPGSPDVSFGPKRVAIFVDGCFWHGCPRCYRAPKTRSEFWRDKVQTNQARDRRDQAHLEQLGWLVLRFWECDLVREESVLSDVRAALESRADS